MTEPSDPKGTAGHRTDARRRTSGRDEGTKPPLRDAVGQIPCLILSLPIAGLGVLAVILAVYKFSDWVTGWAMSALGTPLGLGISGILAILAGAWLTMRIVNGKSAPGTTWAGKLLVLGLAAFLGVVGAALIAAAITPQPAPSTF